jgi:putative DNA methylase
VKKKLIEVALPLDAINAAARKEKSIFFGHPSALHLWWSRKPLAACRAVLLAQLLDDPSAHPDRFPTEVEQHRERERLFEVIKNYVKWENSGKEEFLAPARQEIMRSCDGTPPVVLDPFAGGGSIPLEAQRLGLHARASDLNPVAVLINKALIEIPPKFADRPPVHPRADVRTRWQGAEGLAEDVRRYGRWMRERALERIGRFYPDVEMPKQHGAVRAAAIAWLWTRTVRCANPACGAEMPLAGSWCLSAKKGRGSWVHPVVRDASGSGEIVLDVRHGDATPPSPPKFGRAKFRCVRCGEPAPEGHVKAEAQAGRMGARMMSIVAEGDRQRVYVPANERHEKAAEAEPLADAPTALMAHDPRAIMPPNWGLTKWTDLFTPRQLTAVCTFSDLVVEAREKVRVGALDAGLADDDVPLSEGGTGGRAYAEAVSLYLAFAVSKSADYWSSICVWDRVGEKMGHTFPQQTLQMSWDYAEANPFSSSTGNWLSMLDRVAESLARLPAAVSGKAATCDAGALDASSVVLSTDPPYYDNIGYSDLSDFFYIWLRGSLRDVFPDVCSTLLAPKSQELIAVPHRHNGDKAAAESFFQQGLNSVFSRLRAAQSQQYPMAVYYAFKQAQRSSEGIASTGWSTMLEGLISAGWMITATWPMRTERSNRVRSLDSNALASSIVLACRPRPEVAGLIDRQGFLRALRDELPQPIGDMQKAAIAPVDLRQAAIGPGMAVFSRYARVVEADGQPMRVHTALLLINQVLEAVLGEAEADLDSESRWAVAWYSQHFEDEGPYGVAEQLAVSMNVAVETLARAGIVESSGGTVRLLPRDEMPADWIPPVGVRVQVWTATQQLVRRLEEGEASVGILLAHLGAQGEACRALAYRLYTTCETARPQLAGPYNALAASWPEIYRHSTQAPPPSPATEPQLFSP